MNWMLCVIGMYYTYVYASRKNRSTGCDRSVNVYVVDDTEQLYAGVPEKRTTDIRSWARLPTYDIFLPSQCN